MEREAAEKERLEKEKAAKEKAAKEKAAKEKAAKEKAAKEKAAKEKAAKKKAAKEKAAKKAARERAKRRWPKFEFDNHGLSSSAIHNLMNPYDDRGYDGLYMMNKPKFSQLAQGLGFDVSDDKDDVDDYYGNAKMSMRQPTKNRFIGLGMDRRRNKFRGQHKPIPRPRPYTQPERHNPNDPDYIEQQEPNRFQQHNRRKEPPRNRFEEPPNRNRKRYQDQWFENHKENEEWERPQELGMDKDHQDHKEDRRDRDRPRKEAMTKTKVEYNNPDTVVYGPGNMKPKVRPALRPRPNFGGGRRRPMHKKTRGMRPFGGQGGRPGRRPFRGHFSTFRRRQ